jgi:hypothetical protein
MKKTCTLMAGTFLILGIFLVPSADAQSRRQSTVTVPEDVLPEDYPTIGRMMDQAALNIGYRYNLNEEQLEKTREMIYEGVNSFIVEHQDEVWPMVKSMLAANLGSKPPESIEDLKRVGKVTLRVVEEAKKLIYEKNAEWRKLLSEDQKRMHDFDLQEMDKHFATLEENLKAWERGEKRAAPLFPAPQVYPDEPPRPVKPSQGIPEPKVELIALDFFETRLNEFIKEYDLDPSQLTSAQSIMKQYQQEARDYMRANKQKFVEVIGVQDEAKTLGDRKRKAEADAEHRRLLEPISELAGKMDSRLKALLTTAQIERHKQQAKGGKKKADAGKKADDTKKPASKAPSKESDKKSDAGKKKDR